MQRDNEIYSDEETERRATAALRHALSTPYKSHQDMIRKPKKVTKKRAKKASQAKR